MKPEDISALLPSGADKPAVSVADGVVSLTYTVESHAARVSADDAAIRERFNVVSAEQVDVERRAADGRLVSTNGYGVLYALAPKSPSPKTNTRNG